MKTSVRIAIAAYIIAMAGCTVAFFVQQSIVYSHITPVRQRPHSPMAVTLKDRQSGELREAELTFVNDSVVTNPLGMGNEIEEHLLSLLAANWATGIVLLFVAITGTKQAEPAGAGDA